MRGTRGEDTNTFLSDGPGTGSERGGRYTGEPGSGFSLCHSSWPIESPFPFADEDITSTPHMAADGANLRGISILRDDRINIQHDPAISERWARFNKLTPPRRNANSFPWVPEE